MMRSLSALLAGSLFAVGLILGGMTQPGKVIGFLDVTGHWDPSLAFVIGGALLVYAVLSRLFLRRPAPLFELKFHLPSRRDIDRRLVLGAALFGIGWGLGGYCPGPGLVSLSAGLLPGVFVATMVLGMYAERGIDKRLRT
jgi:uncharacterized membrane protein YedE/YeeE